MNAKETRAMNRLQTENAALRQRLEEVFGHYRKLLYESVDKDMAIKEAHDALTDAINALAAVTSENQ